MESTQASPTQNGQLAMTTKKIDIKVKVKTLFDSPPPPNDTLVDNNTEISGSGGNNSPYRYPKKNYKTDVKKDEWVRWKISEDTSEPGHDEFKLTLLKIYMKPVSGNVNIFGKDPLLPKMNGTIKEQVLDKNNNDEYHYFIEFSITDKNGQIRKFEIDPQLKMT